MPADDSCARPPGALYPRIDRHQYHDSHDYTLWLSDSVSTRLTVEQYAALKAAVAEIDYIELPLQAKEIDAMRGGFARARAEYIPMNQQVTSVAQEVGAAQWPIRRMPPRWWEDRL